MAELKQYRLHLPPAIVRAVVAMCCAFAGLAAGGVLLEFQLSSAVLHADRRLSGPGGLLAHADAELFEAEGYVAPLANGLVARADKTLDGVDRQVAAIGPAVQHVGPVLDGLKDDEARLGVTVDTVNRICGTRDAAGKALPCGTLADVNRTLATVRGTFGAIETAADHEDRNLTTLDAQELALFDDFHATAARTNKALDSFNVLLADPNLALTMKNVGSMTTTADALEKKLAACTLHPTFRCAMKSDVIFGAQVGGYLLR